MSYDLLVFEPANAPRDLQSFEAWLAGLQTAAETADSLVQPATPGLQNFYNGMVRTFPDMNGPSGEGIDDSEMLTGYEFQRDYILMDFRWSVADRVAPVAIDYAERNGLGVFDFNGALIFCDDVDGPSPPSRSSLGTGFFSRIKRSLFG